jgi:hypothetical protein
MQLAVRAFPVRPGYEDKAHHVARQMQGQRAAEAADFYRRHGVVRETWHTQETPSGLWIIAVSQFDGKPIDEAAREYAASQAPFDSWFKDQVRALTGIDPDTTPLGPPTTCIFDSAGGQG